MTDTPYTDALVSGMRLAGKLTRASSFLRGVVAGGVPGDLAKFLEAWSCLALPHRFRWGQFVLRDDRPSRFDPLPLSWKHGDYGCEDLEVSDTFDGLIIGQLLEHEPLPIFVGPGTQFSSVRYCPRLDERRDTVAPTFEEFLAQYGAPRVRR
jgi:hypothetical protein